MRLTESERAENREALSKMGLSAKLGYVFEYYRFPLVLALIAAVALGRVLYYRLTRKEALLFVGFANIAVGDDLDRAVNENTVILEDNDIEHHLDESGALQRCHRVGRQRPAHLRVSTVRRRGVFR